MSNDKDKKPKKKDQANAGGTYDFYVIVKTGSNRPVLYLSDFNGESREEGWSADINAAIWSTVEANVDNFISQNQITDGTKTGKNGEHPSQRPPL